MDECVKSVMNDGKSKESAIAICHNTIMGSSKITNSQMRKVGEIEMSEEKKVEEQIKKQEEAKVEEAPVVETPEVETKEEVVTTEQPTEEAAKEEAPVETPAEEPVVETPVPVVEEQPVEKAEEVKPTEITVKLDTSDFKEEFSKMADAIKTVADKISQVEEKISKSAPTDGASVEKKEETPVEVAKTEAPKEEDAKVEKTESSPAGANDDILKSIAELKSELTMRLEKLESEPAPTKVVFSKDFGGQKQETEEMTVEKINARLEELSKVMSTDPARYIRDNMADEAIALVKQKKAMLKN